jgi:hypothetical protein
MSDIYAKQRNHLFWNYIHQTNITNNSKTVRFRKGCVQKRTKSWWKSPCQGFRVRLPGTWWQIEKIASESVHPPALSNFL